MVNCMEFLVVQDTPFHFPLIELENTLMKIRRSIKVLIGAFVALLLFTFWNSKLCADLDLPKALNEQSVVGSWEGVVEARLKVIGLKVTPDKKAILVISDASSTRKYRSKSLLIFGLDLRSAQV